MKRVVCFLCFTILFSVAYAQDKSSPQIKFVTNSHDFGQIKEVDGTVSYVFEFKNISDKPFIINYVLSSCGCTTPEYNKEPIMPGRTGNIKVAYNPEGRPGVFNKDIVVVSNNRNNEDVLDIKGNVVARPRTIEDDFPLLYSDGLRLSGNSINIGNVARGYSHSGTLYLYNSSDKNLDISLLHDKFSDNVSLELSDKILKPKARAKITITYDLIKSQKYDVLNDTFDIAVNGTPIKTQIHVKGVSIPDFSKSYDTEKVPHIELSSMYYNFGTKNKNDILSYDFEVRNIGQRELVIEEIIPENKNITYSIDKKTIPIGEIAILKITLNANNSTGKVSGKVSIISNDMYDPVVDVRLSANISVGE